MSDAPIHAVSNTAFTTALQPERTRLQVKTDDLKSLVIRTAGATAKVSEIGVRLNAIDIELRDEPAGDGNRSARDGLRSLVTDFVTEDREGLGDITRGLETIAARKDNRLGEFFEQVDRLVDAGHDVRNFAQTFTQIESAADRGAFLDETEAIANAESTDEDRHAALRQLTAATDRLSARDEDVSGFLEAVSEQETLDAKTEQIAAEEEAAE